MHETCWGILGQRELGEAVEVFCNIVNERRLDNSCEEQKENRTTKQTVLLIKHSHFDKPGC